MIFNITLILWENIVLNINSISIQIEQIFSLLDKYDETKLITSFGLSDCVYCFRF